MNERIHWTAIVAALATIAGTWLAAATSSLPERWAAIASAIAAGLLAVGQGLHSMGVGRSLAPPAVVTTVHTPPAVVGPETAVQGSQGAVAAAVQSGPLAGLHAPTGGVS